MERTMHILIVDDEDIVRETLGEFLREFGHAVDEAGDGAAAFKAIEVRAYDLAMIDVRMPGIDGLTLLARSRQLHPQMPVIMMTGHGDPAMSDEAMRLGASDFLLKPIRLTDLDTVLEKTVRIC